MWWKRKKAETAAVGATLLSQVVKGTDLLQRKVTDRLNGRTRHWSNRAKRIFLVAVVLVWGGYSASIFVRSLTSGTEDLPSADYIKMPVIPPEPAAQAPEILSRKDREKIRAFRQFVDSLKSTPDGLNQYQRFQRKHPGLLDSLDQIEGLVEQPLLFHF